MAKLRSVVIVVPVGSVGTIGGLIKDLSASLETEDVDIQVVVNAGLSAKDAASLAAVESGSEALLKKAQSISTAPPQPTRRPLAD